MARSTDDIITQMNTQQAAESGLSSLNNPSQTSIYQLFKYIVAQCINVFEQLMDTKKDEIDTILGNSAPNTEAWLQNKIMQFQYSTTNPQVLSIINYVPSYAKIDESMRIISRCAVKTDINKIVKCKVATGAVPAPLNALQYSSLYGYIDNILNCGVSFDLVNIPSDKLYIEAEIYYDGQYISSIQSNIESALDAYLSNLPFDGSVFVNDIEDTLQSVTGVKDVKIISVKARQDATAFASATDIYNLSTSVNIRKWDTVSGYMVEETTAGNTFSDKITYIVD